MSEFLIYDYTNCEDLSLDDYKIRVVSLRELFDEIDKARDDPKIKIAVYEIGKCLLDWS